MKRNYLLIFLAAASLKSFAGGYLTNTNQSVAFLRNPAKDAYIGISGAYDNPAGIGFMNKGWHVGLNIQNVHQTRSITSFWGTTDVSRNPGFFAQGQGNAANGKKLFKGKAKAPVFPTLDLAYVGNKYFLSFHLGVTGGGGKAEYKNGLGLFESQVSILPSIINALHPDLATPNQPLGYSLNSFVRGRQYYLGGQANVGMKVNKNLTLSVGARTVYVTNNYYGYVRDMSVTNLNPIFGTSSMNVSTLLDKAGYKNLAQLATDKDLNCDQTGWGITPIVGVDYQTGRWNMAMTWEMKTRLRLKNRSGVNTSGLDEYDDGKIVPADLPSFFRVGVQYTALADSTLRLNAGFHWYHDKNATQYQHREKLLADDGYEFLAGTEWDINKKTTLSLGAQYTNYGLGKDSRFINNISFVTDSWSLGLGAKFKLKKNVALNIAYFKTFYMSYTKHMQDYNGIKQEFGKKLNALGMAAKAGAIQLSPQEMAAISKIGALQSNQRFTSYGEDHFDRTNDVFGIGVDIDF